LCFKAEQGGNPAQSLGLWIFPPPEPNRQLLHFETVGIHCEAPDF
jgi:hypothetical protein